MRYQDLDKIKSNKVLYLCILILWGAIFINIIAVRQAVWHLQPQEFDFVQALPISYWVSLFIGTLAGVLGLWLAQTEGLITFCVVGVAFLYGPSFLLGLYPAISGWDSFVHASSAKNLIAGAGIPINIPYAEQYPGPVTLLALVAYILGMEPLVVGVIVTIAAEVALTLLFMGISRAVLGLKASAYSALAILALTPAIVTNEHYSQWLIAYLAIWGTVLLITWSLQEEKPFKLESAVCVLIFGAAIIVSHPFAPVITLAFVFGFAVWSWHERLKLRKSLWWLTITLGVSTLAWMIYVATLYFGQGISVVRDVLLGTKDTIATMSPLPIMDVLKRASIAGEALILLRWVIYFYVGVIALSGLLLKKIRKNVILILWLAIVSATSILIGFASEAPWFQRILYFIPPLLSIAAVITLDKLISNRMQAVGTLTVMLSLAIGFFLWHPPTLLYSVHPLQSGFIIWPQEAAASQYLSKTVPEDEIIGSDLETLIVYLYYNPNYPSYENGISIGSDLEKQLQQNPILYDGTWIIRSRRQEIMGYQAQDLPPLFWGSIDIELSNVADRVYDNGFVVAYHKK